MEQANLGQHFESINDLQAACSRILELVRVDCPECEASLASDDPKFIVDKVTRYMSKHLPTLSWALGTNASGTLSFTLTGEGIVPKQILTDFWLSQAIERPGWEFYASRQPTPRDALQELSIGVSDQDQVDAEHFLIETEVDEDAERIDIVAWHPALEKVDDEHHFQILFLLLDEALENSACNPGSAKSKSNP